MSGNVHGRYESEMHLVRHATRLAREAKNYVGGSLSSKTEVKGAGAVPDLVMYRNVRGSVHYVIAFEFKLKNWKRALDQAFKHRNFSNEAYVVLEEAAVQPAVRNMDIFARANVGLASIDLKEGITVWRYPKPAVPFSYEFSTDFTQTLLSRKTKPTKVPYARTVRGGIPLFTLRTSFFRYEAVKANHPALSPNSTLQLSFDPSPEPCCAKTRRRLQCS